MTKITAYLKNRKAEAEKTIADFRKKMDADTISDAILWMAFDVVYAEETLSLCADAEAIGGNRKSLREYFEWEIKSLHNLGYRYFNVYSNDSGRLVHCAQAEARRSMAVDMLIGDPLGDGPLLGGSK